MTCFSCRIIIPLVAVSALTLAPRAASISAAPARAETARRIYIAATDSKGVPITDLTAAEITVKEGGKPYPVTSLQPATAPMQIAVLVDDHGTGQFQAALAQFLQKAVGHAQFAISTLNPSPLAVVDFTDDVETLRNALTRLGQRGRAAPDGDQLPTAIALSAKTLQQRKAERPVIVVFTLAGAQVVSVDPDYVLKTLRTTGVPLNVISVLGAELGAVMMDGPKETGGRIEQGGTGVAVSAAATKIADMLLHQYVLTYTLPDGVKMADKIAVTTSRKGIELTAQTRIADK